MQDFDTPIKLKNVVYIINFVSGLNKHIIYGQSVNYRDEKIMNN